MAHNVESMFSVREKPWHYSETKDITRIIQEAPTSEEALKAAGLDWDVIPEPIFDRFGNQIPDYVANTRNIDNSVLGIVSNRYSIVQNREAFDFTDNLIGEEMRYETAGSLRNGKQVWLLAKMPDTTIAGDRFEPFICFTNTHDGTGAVRVCMTPIRVVCNNTLNLALDSASKSWSARHTGNIGAKLVEARETLMLANVYMENLKKKAEELATQPMTVVDASVAIKVLLNFNNLKKDQQDRAKQTEEQILACMFMPDLANFFNTKWAFLNAVSDYVGHCDPIRRTKNYEDNRWSKIMTGHPLLNKAMDIVS